MPKQLHVNPSCSVAKPFDMLFSTPYFPIALLIAKPDWHLLPAYAGLIRSGIKSGRRSTPQYGNPRASSRLDVLAITL